MTSQTTRNIQAHIVNVRNLAKGVCAVGLILNSGFTSAEQVSAGWFTRLDVMNTQNIQLRKLLTPRSGFKTGIFTWNSGTNSWILKGSLKQDDKYYASVRLWKKYSSDGSPTEAFGLDTGGIDVKSIKFTSPSGQSYASICENIGVNFGMNSFECDKELPVGQTEFKNGKYVVIFTLTSGAQVTRAIYLNGSYPASFGISYPKNSTSNIPTNPLIKWTALGAVEYDLIIRDLQKNNEIYGAYVSNSIDTTLTHQVPAGVLKPSTAYELTIEPNGPVVNGGSKGLKKRVKFRTAP